MAKKRAQGEGSIYWLKYEKQQLCNPLYYDDSHIIPILKSNHTSNKSNLKRR